MTRELYKGFLTLVLAVSLPFALVGCDVDDEECDPAVEECGEAGAGAEAGAGGEAGAGAEGGEGGEGGEGAEGGGGSGGVRGGNGDGASPGGYGRGEGGGGLGDGGVGPPAEVSTSCSCRWEFAVNPL